MAALAVALQWPPPRSVAVAAPAPTLAAPLLISVTPFVSGRNCCGTSTDAWVAACAAAGVPVVVWVAACVAAGVQACVAEMAHGALSPTISCDGSGMDTAFGATGDSMDAVDVWDQSEESADEF